MPRPKKYDDALRRALVAATAEAIAAQGAEALAVRAVAEAAGTSTNAIYAIFGSRGGLVTAVLADATTSFTRAQRAALRGQEPLADLMALGHAYREWALANPSLYAVMFGDRLPAPKDCEGEPDDSMRPLLETVTWAIEAGAFRGGDVMTMATSIWAAIHGLVSLEAAGRLGPRPPMAELFPEHLHAIAAYWLADPLNSNPG